MGHALILFEKRSWASADPIPNMAGAAFSGFGLFCHVHDECGMSQIAAAAVVVPALQHYSDGTMLPYSSVCEKPGSLAARAIGIPCTRATNHCIV